MQYQYTLIHFRKYKINSGHRFCCVFQRGNKLEYSEMLWNFLAQKLIQILPEKKDTMVKITCHFEMLQIGGGGQPFLLLAIHLQNNLITFTIESIVGIYPKWNKKEHLFINWTVKIANAKMFVQSYINLQDWNI